MIAEWIRKRLASLLTVAMLLSSELLLAHLENEGSDSEEKSPSSSLQEGVNIRHPNSSRRSEIINDSVKDIPNLIDYANEEKEGLINFHPLEPLHDLWNPINKMYMEKMNLSLSIAYTTLYQRATAALGSYEACGDDFDLYGLWTLADKEKSSHPASIGFACESRSKIGAIPPSLMGENIGSLFGTVSTFSRYPFVLIQLWLEYHFIAKKFGFRMGKLDMTDYFNLYTFISNNFSFLNQGLAGDLTVNFPDNGGGIIFGYRLTKEAILIAALSDMNGDRRSMRLDTFFSEREYFSAIEIAYKPEPKHLGKGNYNLMLWHTDACKARRLPSSRGIALSMEQVTKSGLTPFFRYGYSDGRATGITHALGTGVALLHPFKRRDDEFGLGMVWGKPKDELLRSQMAVESYYRLQLSHHIQLSPDVEVIFNPTYNQKERVIAVFSIRLRASL